MTYKVIALDHVQLPHGLAIREETLAEYRTADAAIEFMIYRMNSLVPQDLELLVESDDRIVAWASSLYQESGGSV